MRPRVGLASRRRFGARSLAPTLHRKRERGRDRGRGPRFALRGNGRSALGIDAKSRDRRARERRGLAQESVARRLDRSSMACRPGSRRTRARHARVGRPSRAEDRGVEPAMRNTASEQVRGEVDATAEPRLAALLERANPKQSPADGGVARSAHAKTPSDRRETAPRFGVGEVGHRAERPDEPRIDVPVERHSPTLPSATAELRTEQIHLRNGCASLLPRAVARSHAPSLECLCCKKHELNFPQARARTPHLAIVP